MKSADAPIEPKTTGTVATTMMNTTTDIDPNRKRATGLHDTTRDGGTQETNHTEAVGMTIIEAYRD